MQSNTFFFFDFDFSCNLLITSKFQIQHNLDFSKIKFEPEQIYNRTIFQFDETSLSANFYKL